MLDMDDCDESEPDVYYTEMIDGILAVEDYLAATGRAAVGEDL